MTIQRYAIHNNDLFACGHGALVKYGDHAAEMSVAQARIAELEAKLASKGFDLWPWLLIKLGMDPECREFGAIVGHMDALIDERDAAVKRVGELEAAFEGMSQEARSQQDRRFDALRERDAARAELRALQHAVWHALDDGEERPAELPGLILLTQEHADALGKLIPEEHPDQPAGTAEAEE